MQPEGVSIGLKWILLQIIGTSAIRISWGKNSMSRGPVGATYRAYPSLPPAALHSDAGFPHYRLPPTAGAPVADPYAAYAYALQQQSSAASNPLLQVIHVPQHIYTLHTHFA